MYWYPNELTSIVFLRIIFICLAIAYYNTCVFCTCYIIETYWNWHSIFYFLYISSWFNCWCISYFLYTYSIKN